MDEATLARIEELVRQAPLLPVEVQRLLAAGLETRKVTA